MCVHILFNFMAPCIYNTIIIIQWSMPKQCNNDQCIVHKQKQKKNKNKKYQINSILFNFNFFHTRYSFNYILWHCFVFHFLLFFFCCSRNSTHVDPNNLKKNNARVMKFNPTLYNILFFCWQKKRKYKQTHHANKNSKI